MNIVQTYIKKLAFYVNAMKKYFEALSNGGLKTFFHTCDKSATQVRKMSLAGATRDTCRDFSIFSF